MQGTDRERSLVDYRRGSIGGIIPPQLTRKFRTLTADGSSEVTAMCIACAIIEPGVFRILDWQWLGKVSELVVSFRNGKPGGGRAC
jgi:hypothetical protein